MSKKYPCPACGIVRWAKNSTMMCQQCKTESLIIKTFCIECGAKVILTRANRQEANKRQNYLLRGIAYCSDACRDKRKKKISAQTMAETNYKYASLRMKRNNPMFKDKCRGKMTDTLKSMGHTPPIHGGNGREIPMPQAMLADALGWNVEVVVKTKMGRNSGYPPCYKINVASPELMIGIEVDGNSHRTLKQKELDEKKECFLEGLGWSIVRFTNNEVLGGLGECVEKVNALIEKEVHGGY